MDAVNEVPLLWSTLSREQQDNGVNPEKLKALKFDISESELKTDRAIQQLYHFFLGCRAATSDLDFRSISARLLNSNEPFIAVIKTTMERVLSTSMAERPIQQELGSYPVFIQGEGYGNSDYITKFAETYNGLIHQGQAYLMHPSRREELVTYLGDKFSDASLAADRLIIFRCFGSEKLQLIENSREYDRIRTQLGQMKKKLSELRKEGPDLIMNPNDLQEDALSCIQDSTVRRYTCRIFKELALKGQLSILDLSEGELYDYRGGKEGKAHLELVSAATDYGNEPAVQENFLSVVSCLKMLCSSDLNRLKQKILEKEIETLNACMESVEWAMKMQKFREDHLGILNRDFISNAIQRFDFGLAQKLFDDPIPGFWEPTKIQ